jgi:hypothetical protein
LSFLSSRPSGCDVVESPALASSLSALSLVGADRFSLGEDSLRLLQDDPRVEGGLQLDGALEQERGWVIGSPRDA